MKIQVKSLMQSEAFHKGVVLLGAVCAFGSIIIGWGGLEFAINLAIRKTMRLIPGSTLWETWKTIPVPVYFSVYLFNITNPIQFAEGAKAKLVEIGPYVYLIDFEKYDFKKNENIDTVSYSPSKTYIFQPQKSKGTEDDYVTYVNMMFVAVADRASRMTALPVVLEALDGMLAEQGEKLTRTDKVIDLLFQGVSIQTYIDFMDDPLVQQSGAKLPDSYMDGKFAIFKGRNGTKEDLWECHTGTRDSSELGKLRSYHGKRRLDIYKGDSCNAINGTDGTLNPPFIEPGVTPLQVFIPELCRSVQWEFIGMRENRKIPVARHRFPDIQSVQENPDLWCFCHHDDPMECNQHGIASLSQCMEGAPLLYSKPHFLDVNSSIRNLVEGLRPKVDLHESRLDIHPLTGVSLTASIKIQFSIEVAPLAMPTFSNVSEAIVPIFWIELSSSLEGVTFKLIRLLSGFLKLWPVLRWLCLVGSLGLAFIGLFFVYRGRKSLMNTIDPEDEEEMEVISQEVWVKKFNQNQPSVEISRDNKEVINDTRM